MTAPHDNLRRMPSDRDLRGRSPADGDPFDPFVHWPGRFALRRAVKRVALGRSDVATEWRRWRASRHLPDGSSGSLRPGASLLGCSRAENGIGESCRLAAESLATAGVPFGVVNMPFSLHARQGDLRTVAHEIAWPGHRANVFHMNPPEMRAMLDLLGRRGTRNRLAIAVWHWELPRLPGDWRALVPMVDEFWAPSRFIAEALREAGGRRVETIPHGVAVPTTPPMPRAELGIDEDRFVFLVMYDVASHQRRKNPEAAIEAFRRAFGPDDGPVLVVKLQNAHVDPAKADAIGRLAADRPSIRVLRDVLDRERVRGLVRTCDCLVSLHRSEGFGLGPAEAMALGKPVIATDWSSTTDFVRREHACPVGYRLVPVGGDAGPYEGAQQWADPDVDEAADWMRRLAADPAAGREIGRKAAAFMAANFHPSRSGDRMRQRLLELGALDGHPPRVDGPTSA